MPQGTLNANGSSPWFKVINGPVNISVQADFGGGTVTIEKEVEGQVFDLLDAGVAITHTVADDSVYQLHRGTKTRVTLAGATNPSMVWSIRGS